MNLQYEKCRNAEPPKDTTSRTVGIAISEYLGSCDPDTSIFHLGATSVTVVNLVHRLQHFSISAADIYKLETPRKIAGYLSDNKSTKDQRNRG